jgi:signal transduction histidine kinase
MPNRGRIDIRAVQTGAEVTIRVRDQGIGIPTVELSRIFEVFTQLGAARARYRGGLGIGLSLVKRFVELHGGSVVAYSRGPGCGSEFVMRLPTGNAPENNMSERFDY